MATLFFKKRLWRLLGIFFLIVLIPFLFWAFKPESEFEIPLWLLVLMVTLIGFVIYALIDYINIINEASLERLPRIIYAERSPGKGKQEFVNCLLEPSELLSFSVIVSFYYSDGTGYERFMGWGVVNNIQDDKKILVELRYFEDIFCDEVQRLAENNSEILKRIKIKPCIRYPVPGLAD